MNSTNISKEEFDRLKVMDNFVLVKPILNTEKLSNGLFMPDSWDESVDGKRQKDFVNAKRIVEVIRVPDKLTWDEEIYYPNESEWQTEMELKEGDIAWVDYIYTVQNNKNIGNMKLLTYNEEEYLFIPYSAVIFVKRGTDNYFPVNGYVLVKLEEEKTTALEYTKVSVNNKIGEIKYIGKANTDYKNDKFSDEVDVGLGDRILINKKSSKNLRYLEEDLHKTLPEMYIYIQRRHIVAKF